MSRFKKWLHATWITITTALGVQYARPPVIDVQEPPPIVSTATPTVTPVPTVAPPNALRIPRMEAGKLTGAVGTETEMYQASISMGNIIGPSDCFKEGFDKSELTETNGLTNPQVYDVFASAPLKVNVEFFYGTWTQNYISKTMGIDKGDGIVYANRFYITDAPTLNSLEWHEGAHQRDFRHDGVKATSVPYTANRVQEMCAKKLGITK